MTQNVKKVQEKMDTLKTIIGDFSNWCDNEIIKIIETLNNDIHLLDLADVYKSAHPIIEYISIKNKIEHLLKLTISWVLEWRGSNGIKLGINKKKGSENTQIYGN